jgi:hypothetical protein
LPKGDGRETVLIVRLPIRFVLGVLKQFAGAAGCEVSDAAFSTTGDMAWRSDGPDGLSTRTKGGPGIG